MIFGATIMAKSDTSDTTYFSPWFQKGGNELTCVCDVIASQNLNDNEGQADHGFRVDVQTKQADESDASATTLGSSHDITITSDNTRTSFTAGAAIGAGTGFKELCRFKVMLRLSSSQTMGWVHCRMLNPSWLSD